MLTGKRILITGVVTRESIAYAVAERAQALGAEIVLTGFGRGLALTRRVARRLPDRPEVLELDVNEPSHFGPLAARIESRMLGRSGRRPARDRLRAARRARRPLPRHTRRSALVAFRTSAFSFQALTAALEPLLTPHGSVVGLDFDAPVAWPAYDWMGVSRRRCGWSPVPGARARPAPGAGPRPAGPLRTMASGGVPLFDEMADAWTTQAPLGGTLGPRPGGRRGVHAAVGLCARDDRGDRVRGRRRPRHGPARPRAGDFRGGGLSASLPSGGRGA